MQAENNKDFSINDNRIKVQTTVKPGQQINVSWMNCFNYDKLLVSKLIVSYNKPAKNIYFAIIMICFPN